MNTLPVYHYITFERDHLRARECELNNNNIIIITVIIIYRIEPLLIRQTKEKAMQQS